MLPTHKPHHPGDFIRQDILEEFNLDAASLAEKLDVPEPVLRGVIAGRRKLSADLAWRLGKFTKTSPELWMNLQMNLDLWRARKKHAQDMQRIKAFDAAVP